LVIESPNARTPSSGTPGTVALRYQFDAVRLTSFRARLAGIVCAGFALRVVYTLALARHDNPPSSFGDAFFFHSVANLIADGHGFSHPFYWLADHYAAPTAAHPPLWPLVLAAFSAIGADGHTAHRLVGDLVGAGVIAVAGLLGARVGGSRTGLIAAAVAGVYPIFIAADGSVMSEPLSALTVGLAMLAAYRFGDRPAPARAALLGAAIGAAALARGEALALLVLLAAPAVWLASRARARDLAMVVAATVLVLTPWTIRNAVAFDRFVPLSTNLGSVVGGANCDAAYHGRFLGAWLPSCAFAAAQPPRDGRLYDEAALADRWLAAGRSYAEDHAGRLLVVAAVRVLRTWSLWQPRQQALYYDGENRAFARVAVLAFFPLALLACAGVVMLRRRRLDLLVLLAAPAMVTATSVAGYGTYRFRHAAELSLVLLASRALAGVVTRRAGR
jgi:hypothetical protein